MGTRWRGLLAPINLPTGDGRRMADGAMRWRELPLGLKWQREDDVGHDASVIIGSTDTVNIGTRKQAVDEGWISAEAAARTKLGPDDVGLWGGGDLFDDVDPTSLPRLAEDVAEAKLLIDKQVVGASVDAGAATAVLVEEGTDEPLTEERMDELWMEAMESGEDPPIELLFTDYEVAAATLVAIPAFAEAQPFELLLAEGDCPPGQHPMPDGGCMPDEDMPADDEAASTVDVALVAALTAAAARYPVDAFERPEVDGVQPITVEQRAGEAFQRVAGYAATWGTCHTGLNVCTTAPRSESGYAFFHRYDLPGFPQPVGRLTTGHGKVGTGCACCRGKDDHACDAKPLHEAIAHYDRLKTLAYVRVGEDEYGIWVAGVLAPDVDEADRAVLARQYVSGDWRPVGDRFEFTELLALGDPRSKPGFPVSVKFAGGRQLALVAAGMVRPDRPTTPAVLDPARLADTVADRILARLSQAGITTTTLDGAVTAAKAEHTGVTVALVPSPDDAARLAVEGGEAADDLHLTLATLGEADQDVADQILEAVWTLAEQLQPVNGEVSSVHVFTPDGADADALVVGVSGEGVDETRALVEAALFEVAPDVDDGDGPGPMMLAATADPEVVDELAESRTGPIVFDRFRVVLASTVVDIPLGQAPESAASQAAALAAEVEAVLALVDAPARAREAARLLEEVGALV